MNKLFLMLHHSLTKDGDTVSWKAIEEYHTRVNGWKDIGYNWGFELIQGHYYSLVGRDVTQEAAACKEGRMNQLAEHLCWVGNFDEEKPSETGKIILIKRLVIPILKRLKIGPSQIVGHNQYATYKSCPGKLFDLESFRHQVGEALT